MDLIKRPRRLRSSSNMRKLVGETRLDVSDLVYPLFITEGRDIKKEIASMPGICNFSLDRVFKEIEEICSLGITSIILFGIPEKKDEVASQAYDDNGIIQKALRAIKKEFPDLVLITDVCLCEYTSHGHCGIVCDGRILNDESVELICKTSVSYARAGADIVAPSDMMDGRTGAVRKALDKDGYEEIPIMAYSAKYASSFYGPFRDAAQSAPAFGDRKTYQMDCGNFKEALREVELDIEEGADIVMVKPALPYLDVIRAVSERVDVPVAAYHVSGEYSMIKAAAMNGWVDEKAVVMESLTAIKRAGAKIIISYYAKQAAQWLKEA